MIRMASAPRANAGARVRELGLIWHQDYWDETACWQLTATEVAAIEIATEALHQLFIAAGQHIIDHDRLGELGIPDFCHQAICESWNSEPAALNIGRFDLGLDGNGVPRLFEYNCDTPTSLLEAAIIQWDWKAAVFPDHDQCNSLHERLVDRWRAIAPPPGTSQLHIAHLRDASGEDSITAAYHADCAREAGIDTRLIAMEDIGWDHRQRRFVDNEARPMDAIFHLYPWEWLIADDFGRNAIESLDSTLWIEPIWKMLWSNKGILPILWELFPGHPNLLEASTKPLAGDHVQKPLLSREGANVSIRRDGRIIARSDGDYGDQACIWQRFVDLPGAGEQRPVIGAWCVDGHAAGIGIREGGLITDNRARFVPHIIGG